MSHATGPPSSSPASTATPAPTPKPTVSQYACKRSSPRPCMNQALVDALAPLREAKFLGFGTQSEKSIAYATVVSVIIGTPFRIETVEQAKALPKIGPKLITRIDEFLRKGYIQDSRATEKFQTFKLLQSLNGIGYSAANDLYGSGIRTLEVVAVVRPDLAPQLKDLPNLQTKIPRSEVESIHAFVRLQIDKVKKGSHSVLCGGYRRGKEFSNDVDILVTWPHQEGAEKGVFRKLVERLRIKGFIPDDSCILGYSEAGSSRTTTANRPADRMDALDKALIIFRHLANATSRPRDKFRRVDIVVANWKVFGCAVVGWSGSTHFERDLRRYANKKNFVFDSGSERDVFRLLELDWIPRELRNADP
ncbi:hypothetical protein JCM8547_006755 [Rhodosporidiobolus lusitaniae]